MIERSQVMGVVLAGGQSRRMGGTDKALLHLGGVPLVERVTHRLGAQTHCVAINANAGADAFAHLPGVQTLPVVADEIGGHIGPLAGIHAAMRFAASIDGISHIATAATDTPFFPHDLVTALANQISADAPIAMATSNNNRHPVFALWSVELADRLASWLAMTETYKVVVFARDVGMTTVDFPFENGQDPFFNINTPDDLSVAETRLFAS
ncbi:MAG: molybdenum cofactor guanylyltransferase MobA [Ahrensia sp.]